MQSAPVSNSGFSRHSSHRTGICSLTLPGRSLCKTSIVKSLCRQLAWDTPDLGQICLLTSREIQRRREFLLECSNRRNLHEEALKNAPSTTYTQSDKVCGEKKNIPMATARCSEISAPVLLHEHLHNGPT